MKKHTRYILFAVAVIALAALVGLPLLASDEEEVETMIPAGNIPPIDAAPRITATATFGLG